VNTDLESSSHSVGYTVWGVNDLGGGLYTPGSFEQPPDSTIFLEAEYDSCQAAISLSWNDYNKWRGSIGEYNIIRRQGPLNYVTVAADLPEGTNNYVLNSILPNQQYDLFVQAVHQDMTRRSTSNRIQVTTSLTQQTSTLNADYATLGPENTISLSFSVMGTSDQSQFNLVRSTSPGGPFNMIASINTDTSQFIYTDNISFTSGIFFYRLEGLNNCSQVSYYSNLANNILLNGTMTSNQIEINWNEYIGWSAGVEQYRITRRYGRNNPVVDILDVGLNTSFQDDISSLANYENPVSSLVCYQVEATENPNQYGNQGKSLSNQVCFSIYPNIRMPNAFIPNDDDPANQVFEPVFSFLPEQYDMVIYNRLGTKVWEGSSGWDGTMNGQPVPEGVYLYYIRVSNYSTDIIELNGKVTVVYR
jgi:gliding motility-associated-like protein